MDLYLFYCTFALAIRRKTIQGTESPLFFCRMINHNTVRQLAEEHLAGTDLFLVDITINAKNKIAVYVDRMGHVAIKDCVSLSRHIESNLDREAEDFELEVSSPGLDKPFKVIQQYEKNIGKAVEVVLKDGRKIEGTLTEASAERIVLEQHLIKKVEGKKTKQKTTEQHPFAFADIKETYIVISF